MTATTCQPKVKVPSLKARARKRGETEEAYARRIRDLELLSARQRSFRERVKQAALAPAPAPAPAPQSDVGATVRGAAEEALRAEALERRAAQTAMANLQLKLEAEMRETAELKRAIEAQADSLRVRNRVEEVRRRAELAKQAKAVEIIGDSGDGNGNDGASEIIQDFPHRNARMLDTVTTYDKCLKYKELSGSGNASGQASGYSTPPFRGGVECPEVTFDDSSPIPVTDSAGDSNQTRPTLPLAKVAEMVLLIGWLDRARASLPGQPLVVRFGAWERRIWLSVVAAFAQPHQCDLDEPREDVPFAYELAWALRWALSVFPPGCAIPELAWRTLGSSMRPQNRETIGVLADLESVEAVIKKFRAVERELQAKTLILIEANDE